MTTDLRAFRARALETATRRLDRPVTGLFFGIFLYAAVWALVDAPGTYADTEQLGFPGYFTYPLAVAKLAGLAVIAWGRLRTLSGLAFAGFFYDVVLATSAQVAQGNPGRAALAVLAVAVTAGAYLADRRRHGTPVP